MNDRRRNFLILLGGILASPAFAQEGASWPTAYLFSFKGIDGRDIRLADYVGKPILIVNTASLCGYTPQYTGLERLWKRYHERGLAIIGVPSNDFLQEPGNADDILKTTHEYGVDFPMTEKTAIKGAAAHPFYKWAALEKPLDTPRWNFHKYLVGDDGHIAAAFATTVEPMDARVISAVEKELAKTT